MAQKVAEIKVPISLVVEGGDVDKKVREVYKKAQSEVNKNKIKYQLDIDKSGAQQFSKFIGEIKESGKKVVVNIDDEAFLNQIKNLKIKSKKEFEQVKEVLKSVIDFTPKDSPSFSLANNLLKDIAKFDTVIAKLEEYQKKLKSIQADFDLELADHLQGAYGNYKSNPKNKKAVNEFIASFEMFDDYAKDQKLDFDVKVNGKSISVGFQEISDEYNKLFDTFEINDEEVEKALDGNILKTINKYEKSLKSYEDKIKSLKLDIEKPAPQKTTSKKQKEVERSKEQSDGAKVSIKPINLEEFYKEIENFRKANIQVEVANKENIFTSLENKTIDVKINPLIKNIESNIEGSFKESAKSIEQQITKIFSSASKKGFSNDDYIDLNNLYKNYKDVSGKGFAAGKLLSAFNIDRDKYIKEFAEVKKSFAEKSSGGSSLDLSVGLKIDDSEISSLKSKIESGISPIDVEVKLSDVPKENNYGSLIEDLKEVVELQKQVNFANKDITSTKSNGKKLLPSSLIDRKDIRSNSTTKKSIERLIGEYNESDDTSKDSVKEKLAAYVGAYKDVISANDIFGEKNKTLWNEVISLIEEATKAQQAYSVLQEKSNSVLEKTALLGNVDKDSLTNKDKEDFVNSLRGGLSGATDFLNGKFGNQISGFLNEVKSELSTLDTYVDKAVSSIKEISLNGIEPVDVKFVPKTEEFDEEVKRIKALSPIQLDVNLRDITEGTDKIDVSGLESSVSDLKTNIISIGSSFANVDNVILESSIKQISSIDSVTASVKELKNQMDSIGINTLVEAQNVVKRSRKNKKPVTKKPPESQVLDVKKKVLSAFDKTDNIDFEPNSIKVLEGGIVTFNNKLEETRYLISDINKLLKKDGSVDLDLLNSGAIEFEELKKIEKTKSELIKAINERRGLDVNADSTEEGTQAHKRIGELKQKENALQEQLNASLDKNKLTLLEIQTINKEINEAKNKEVKGYSVAESKLNRMAKSLEKIKEVNVDDLRNIDIKDENGNLVNLRTKYQELRNEAALTYEKISSGNYSGKVEAEKLSNELTEQIDKMKKLANANNYIVNNKGRLAGSFELNDKKLSQLENKEIQDKIMDVIKRQYGANKRYDDIKYNPSKNRLTANLIDGDTITPITANLREYSTALNKAAVEVRTLSGAEKEYQSAGSRWISGFKAKLNSLSQYMTGIEVVMRGIQEIKEGFNFVKELDASMTTVYQTMDITREGLKDLSTGAIDQARALGSASEQVVDAIGIYAAYGETVDSILSKTKPTTMLANAAQIDAKTASDQIQGVLQQYEELEGQEMRIVNSYEKIAANIQIDFDKGIQAMAEGVQTAGSVTRDAGK